MPAPLHLCKTSRLQHRSNSLQYDAKQGCARKVYLISLKIKESHVFVRKTLEDAEEDVDTSRIFAWKTLNHYFEIKTYIIQLMDLRLPGKCSRGVHIFHRVFQRLPQKHGRYCYIPLAWNLRPVTLTSAVEADVLHSRVLWGGSAHK